MAKHVHLSYPINRSLLLFQKHTTFLNNNVLENTEQIKCCLCNAGDGN